MIKRWLNISILILAISAPGMVLAEHEPSGRQAPSSTGDFGPESGIVLVAQNEPAENRSPAVKSGVYNTLAIYKGLYEPKRIYKRRTTEHGWIGNTKPSHIQQVQCREAYATLNAGSLWKGNLNTDGSCGNPAEPADWALGNYLNYHDAAAGDD